MNRLKFFASIMASTLLVAGCGPLASTGSSSAQAQAVTVPAAAAERGSIQQTLAYSGDVRAK